MKLDHNRLDIVCVDQQNKNCLITDITCPCDKRMDIEQEINIKYSQQDYHISNVKLEKGNH